MELWTKTEIHSLCPLKFSGYLGNFYFYLDLLAVITMIPEVSWTAKAFGMENMNDQLSIDPQWAKASRLVRVVRLVRVIKLFNLAKKRKAQADHKIGIIEELTKTNASVGEIEGKDTPVVFRESNVGEHLSESITRKVIGIILIMLCATSLLQYIVIDEEMELGTSLLNMYNSQGVNGSRELGTQIFQEETALRFGEPFLLSLEIEPPVGVPLVHRPDLLDTLRLGDIVTVSYSEWVSGGFNDSTTLFRSSAHFNIQPLRRYEAVYQLCLTIFISFAIIVASTVFNNDARRLVLAPIEKMAKMMQKVSQNPLQPLDDDDPNGETNSNENNYELILLESAIKRITKLLRIGFGEAGANIVSSNLIGQSFDPMVPGLMIYGIFGFCDVHQFDFASRHLDEDILHFINNIAELVHGCVHEWSGQCNKNLGNAFLMIWRIGDEDEIMSVMGGGLANSRIQKKKAIDLRRVPGVDVLADHALIGFLKVIAGLPRSKYINKFKRDHRLSHYSDSGFDVSMGFGLHAGWAIEGAVGSVQKVDATYLSPHVNMAARLETSSRQYKVPILISQTHYDIMSEAAKHNCRRVDVVTVKGSENPIGIYTYDCDQQGSHNQGIRSSTRRFCTPSADSAEVMEHDYDLLRLRSFFTPELKDLHRAGVDAYVAGDWQLARTKLSRCNELTLAKTGGLHSDGPSSTILDHMEKSGYIAPGDWKGYRPLTSK